MTTQFELIRSINLLLQKSSDENQAYPAIFQMLKKILTFDAGTLYILNDKRDRLQRAYQFGSPEVDLASEFAIGQGKGLSGWIAQRREPVVIASLTKARVGREGCFRSLLSLPLVAEDQLIGVLNLGSNNDGEFKRDELDFYRDLAAELSLIIAHIWLQNRLKQQNRQLEAALKELKNLQAQLVAKERLAAIGEVVITVNHEINNPLTSIMGLAEMLNMNSATLAPERLRHGLGVILREARRIQQVTHQLANLKEFKSVEYYGGKKMIALHSDQSTTADQQQSPAQKV